MVAVGFAALFGPVLIAVRFDLLRVDGQFPASRARAGEDGPLVVSHQGNQTGQRSGIPVPFNRDVQSAAWVDSCSASADGVNGHFELLKPGDSAQFRADEFASLATRNQRADRTVVFCPPSFGQPGNLIPAVVRPNWRRIAGGQGGFEFDPEGNLVGVHREVLGGVWFVVSLEVACASRVTHEPCAAQNLKPGKAAFCPDFACFPGTPREAPNGPVWRRRDRRMNGRSSPQDATVRNVSRQEAELGIGRQG